MMQKRRVVVLGGLLALVVGGTAVPVAQASSYRSGVALEISQYANRSDGHALQGATWNGLGYIFVKGGGITSVSFTLDGKAVPGRSASVDSVAPWDFISTAANGQATPLKSSSLDAGKHTVVANVALRNGSSKTLSSSFEIVAETSGTPPEPASPSTSAKPPTSKPTSSTPTTAKPPTTPTSSSPTAPGTIPPTSVPASTGSVAGLKNVAFWRSQYDSAFSREDSDNTKLSTSGDSWDQYGLSYAIDGAVSMFVATGDTKYLDQALKYTNNVVGTAKVSSSLQASQWKDSYLGWSSFQNLDPGEQPNEYPLYESYMWRYVTNMLVAMKQNSAVMADAKYKSQYDKVLAFTEKNIFDKWYNRDAEDHVYRQNAHMASHWAMISLDLSLVSTDASRVAKAKTVYTNIDNGMPSYGGGSLHKLMRKQSDGAYVFYGDFDGKSNRLEDSSHGNGVMAYVVHANALGTSWTAADMKAFTVTFNKRIWPSATKYAELVDGSGSDNGWFSDGWVDLGRFDAALQKRLESHQVGRGPQFSGSMALNAKILGVK